MFVKIDRCLSEHALNKLCEGNTATNLIKTQWEEAIIPNWHKVAAKIALTRQCGWDEGERADVQAAG